MTAPPSLAQDPGTQDPEDVFELPDPYDYGGQVIARRRSASLAPKISPGEVQGRLERRRETADNLRSQIELSLASPHSDPDLVELMRDADFADVAALTPLGAAVAEARLGGGIGFGARHAVPVWAGVRGLPYALEAFSEFCHLNPTTGSDPALKRLAGRPHLFAHWEAVRFLLDLVRSASDQEYAEAMRTAARLREDDPSGLRRALTTFLFAEREDWLWADIQAAHRGQVSATALLPSVVSADQAAAVGELIASGPAWYWSGDLDIEVTYLTAAGAEALPFLLAWYDGYVDPPPGSEGRIRVTAVKARIIDLIARVPRDEAMRALVSRIDDPGVLPRLQTATKRFPHRALRALAEAEPAATASRVLTMVALADPDFTRAGLPFLSAGARRRVEALLDAEPSSSAALDQLPDILAAPPWRDRKRKPVKPVVVEGLTPPAGAEVAWLPGERERWLTGHGSGWQPERGWQSFAASVVAGEADEQFALYFAAYAPEDLVRPLLTDWAPPLRWANERAQGFVARYETLALPTVLAISGRPGHRARLLQPFVNPEIATLMVDGMTRLRSVRGLAVSWLRRHPEAAARCLVPAALGKRGRARQNATAGLRVIEAAGTDVAAVAAAYYGDEVGCAVKELLADDGLGGHPRTMPAPPIWARAAVLAPIRIRDAEAATLPLSAVQAVVEMLAISKPDNAYAGLETVKEFCDTAALGEFAWSLFTNWEQAGEPAKEKWAVDALGLLGDDAVVDRLVPLIRTWSDQGRYHLAYDALAVLAAIGGDRALAQLHRLAEKARPNAVRKRARQRFEDVAESLDLSTEQLADRVVPDLGLGADGTVRLDYGPRYFDVGFDELLRPRILDQAGRLVKNLPRPGMKDDPQLAAASYKEFTELKKAARTVAAEQIKRLEQAMFTRRRWQPADFAACLVPHPLLRHITRRLVWGVYGADGLLIGSFRVAEDLSCADVRDAHYEIPDGAVIGVAHPVDLGTALGEWSEVFADYEVLQPFEQLGRPVLELTRGERGGRALDRFGGFSVRAVSIAGLETRGWVRGPIGDGPTWSSILRPVGDERFLVAEFAPGIMAGAATQSEYQGFTKIWLSVTGEHPAFDRHSVPLSELNAVAASEILRDLEDVVKR